jgi:hypothetical protein
MGKNPDIFLFFIFSDALSASVAGFVFVKITHDRRPIPPLTRAFPGIKNGPQ